MKWLMVVFIFSYSILFASTVDDILQKNSRDSDNKLEVLTTESARIQNGYREQISNESNFKWKQAGSQRSRTLSRQVHWNRDISNIPCEIRLEDTMVFSQVVSAPQTLFQEGTSTYESDYRLTIYINGNCVFSGRCARTDARLAAYGDFSADQIRCSNFPHYNDMYTNWLIGLNRAAIAFNGGRLFLDKINHGGITLRLERDK